VEIGQRLVTVACALSLIVSCACASSHPPAAAPVADDPRMLASANVFGALRAGDPPLATRDFDETMRVALPPRKLAADWRQLIAENGPLDSWRLLKKEPAQGYERWIFALTFRERSGFGLVVFGGDGRIAGLFFRIPAAAPARGSAPTAANVQIHSRSGELPGVLLAPPHAGAPAMGIVMVAGSGANDRDETVGTMKPFRDLAEGLAARGIASVRYDKRTFALPATMGPASTVEDEVIADAVEAMRVLRASPGVDPRCTFVLGHSLGALLAPEIASRAGGVRGLILLAPPGRAVLTVTLEQLRRHPSATPGLTELEAKARDLDRLPAQERLLGVPVSYWRDLDGRDELALARKLGLPVTLMRGDADMNIQSVDIDAWRSALAGHVPVEVQSFPGLDHLFTVPAAVADETVAGHVRQDVIEAVAAFVKRTGCPAAP